MPFIFPIFSASAVVSFSRFSTSSRPLFQNCRSVMSIPRSAKMLFGDCDRPADRNCLAGGQHVVAEAPMLFPGKKANF
ncbi:MAG: hypothetical protein A2010_12190 [Nitrospirae bacterium GWD2_57_9]|nr:MAG: hypothetical protein A2010_12190 [Nitrospirae bacterium GWD2_57_9]